MDTGQRHGRKMAFGGWEVTLSTFLGLMEMIQEN